jgi:hypothetical protein
MNSIFPIDTEIKSEVINGLQIQLYKGLVAALEKNNKESVNEILDFVFKTLNGSIFNNSTAVYNQLMDFPIWSYELTNDKYPKFKDEIRKRISQKLLSTLSYGISFRNNNNIPKVTKTENQLYYLTYQTYLKLIHRSILYSQAADTRFFLKEFKKINRSYERTSLNLRFQAEALKKANKKIEAIELLEDTKYNNFNVILHFQSSFAISSWLFYLYYLNRYELNELTMNISELHEKYTNLSELIEDYSEFSSENRSNYLGVGEWDYIERPEGVVYSPPQVTEWMTIGLIIYLLRSPHLITSNFEDIPDDYRYYFLYDNIKGRLELIKDNFDKWKNIIACENLGVFSERSQMITSLFAQLQRRHISLKEATIADLKLSAEKVQSFQALIGNTWLNSSAAKQLFNYFNSEIPVTEENLELTRFGSKTFFHNAKTLFTDENHQHIYGIEEMATNLSSLFDNTFFDLVIKSKEIDEQDDLITALNEAINDLNLKGVEPTIIILSGEYAYQQQLLSNSQFINKFKMTSAIEGFNCIGTFGDIPVCSTFNELLKNKLIVADFYNSFSAEIYENQIWQNKQIEVEVSSITEEVAFAKLNQNKEHWLLDDNGNTLTEIEALTRIKNSVIIDVWIKAKFNIINTENFVIMQIPAATY